jgi:hypothetical protein
LKRAALLAALALAGCASPRLAARQADADRFNGQNESEVVRQLGTPSRTEEAGGRRLLVYEERRVDFAPGIPGSYVLGSPFGPAGMGYGANAMPQAVELSCRTTYEIAGGRVSNATLRGNHC